MILLLSFIFSTTSSSLGWQIKNSFSLFFQTDE
jgi:hypothetical protein